MPKRQVLLVYLPVLHKGYWQFFEAYPKVKEIYVFGNDILNDLDYINKDLRALNLSQQLKILVSLDRFEITGVIRKNDLPTLDNHETKIIMPSEDVSRAVAKQMKKASVELYPIFLRWDRDSVKNVNQQVPNELTTDDISARKYMRKAIGIAGNSSDIWRRVGAVLVSRHGEEIGISSNRSEPSDHTPWIEGDPRNLYKRGLAIEQSLFTHAEAMLIANSARLGRSLEGASIYVTTFPCPACAKLIAHSGIGYCYYAEGYAVLDGGRVMDQYGVKTIRVIMPDRRNRASVDYVPYKK